MPTSDASVSPSSALDESEFVQRPECCVLPTPTQSAQDYLGSFVSLKDGTWIRLGISIILAGQSMVWGLAVNLSEIPAFSIVYWALHGVLALSALLSFALLGVGLLRSFFKSVMDLRIGIESLFMLSLLGALGGSIYATLSGSGNVYYEVIIVVLVIFSFGRKIGNISKEKALAEANRYREQFDSVVRINENDDSLETIPYCELETGNLVKITPGSPICANGIILKGEGFIKETALTGEPHPIIKKTGDALQAGTWSVDATLIYRAELGSEEHTRTIDSILDKVKQSIASSQSRRQIQAESWIQYFVIFVATIAILNGLFWSLHSGLHAGWLNSMSVLLIACPCALGLATPLAIWTGLWQLSSLGVVSRSSHLMDALAHSKHVYFDKTGTLTESSLSIGNVNVLANAKLDKSEILSLAAILESDVEHPIARAFDTPNVFKSDFHSFRILSKKWIPGKGIEASIEFSDAVPAQTVKLGTPLWAFSDSNENVSIDNETKTVALSIEGQPIASIQLIEDLRPGVESLIKTLQTYGIRTTILTGDPFPQWKQISGAIVRENLTPDQKAELVKVSKDKGENPLFVGDGINDINAMLQADASIAIHDGGVGLTQSNANAILVGNNLSSIGNAIKLARKIDQTLVSNLRIAVIYNLIGISLASMGILHPVASVLIMVISSMLVSFRAIQKTQAIATA